MRSNAGMANRQGDVDLRFTQVDVPQLTLWLGLAWLGLAWLGLVWLGLGKQRVRQIEKGREEIKKEIRGIKNMY